MDDPETVYMVIPPRLGVHTPQWGRPVGEYTLPVVLLVVGVGVAVVVVVVVFRGLHHLAYGIVLCPQIKTHNLCLCGECTGS